MHYLQARSINTEDVCWILIAEVSSMTFLHNEKLMDRLEEEFSYMMCPNGEDYFGLEEINKEQLDFIQAFDIAPIKKVIIWFNMDDADEKFKDGIVVRKGRWDFRFPN